MTTTIIIDFNTDDPRIIELCKRYWALDSEERFVYTVTSLAREAAMSVRDFGTVVYESCNAYTTDDSCAICGASYIYTNRTDFSQRRRNLSSGHRWLCDECKTAERERTESARLAREAQQRDLIRERFQVTRRQIIPDEISLRDAVFLVTLLRHLASEDLEIILPVTSKTYPLTPTRNFDSELVRHLYDVKLIAVHPESPLESFVFNEGIATQFYLLHVMWGVAVNTEPQGIYLGLIEQIEQMFQDMDWPVGWHSEVDLLWREIAVQECLAYLNLALEDHKLPFTPGEKTIQTLYRILNHYSISQIYSFMWRAAKDAAAFYTRERVTKQHAANTVVGAIERAAERAYANGWHVMHYGRERRLPESVLNQVFFNRVLQIGDQGFTSAPHWNISVEEDDA